VHPDSGIASLSIALGCDASQIDLDGPLPEIPESNASKSGRERVIERARRDNLTVHQLAQIAGSYGGRALAGTPAMIADQMEVCSTARPATASTSCSRGSRAASPREPVFRKAGLLTGAAPAPSKHINACRLLSSSVVRF